MEHVCPPAGVQLQLLSTNKTVTVIHNIDILANFEYWIVVLQVTENLPENKVSLIIRWNARCVWLTTPSFPLSFLGLSLPRLKL